MNKDFPIIVTTSRRSYPKEINLAQETATKLGGKFVPRQKLAVAAICQKYNTPVAVVCRDNSIVIEGMAGTFFFHPSMAHVRLKNLRTGGSDHLLTALGLTPGMSVLDCTLGLGADAIVESYAVGASGRIVALENSPLIACAVSYGLSHHTGEAADTMAAMRRIEVVNADYHDYLSALPDKSFDAVYFDPMFRFPLEKSIALAPVRLLADQRPLDETAIKEARRVAKRSIVMKEAWYSKEFSRLGFPSLAGGRYSRIRFGIITL